MPVAAEPRRQPGGDAHQLSLPLLWPTHSRMLSRVCHTFSRPGVAKLAHLVIDPIGGAAQRQLAQGDQVAFAEEVLNGALGTAGNIHFAFVQPSAQIVRRQIDQHHFAGLVKHVVGHRFAHPHAGHAAHYVVQAFQMLYVDGCQHVDAGIQQLFHILPAFGVARTVSVAVRQFIHQHQRRVARQRGVEIEFMHQPAAMLDAFCGSSVRPSSRAAVSLRPWVSTTPTSTSSP